MKLTGKCKKSFEKWCDSIDEFGYHFDTYENFKELTQSMQFGIYVDFFDTVEIDVDVCKSSFIEKFYVYLKQNTVPVYVANTRPEAREQAILKANEIYNDKI